MTQRPELFGACLPAVGVMDMLRFHQFTEGRTWVDDYGSSDNPAGVQGPAGLFALSQHQARHALSGHADHARPTPTTAWCLGTASSLPRHCNGPRPATPRC